MQQNRDSNTWNQTPIKQHPGNSFNELVKVKIEEHEVRHGCLHQKHAAVLHSGADKLLHNTNVNM